MNFKKLFSNQRFQFGGNAALLVVSVIGIIVLINLLLAGVNIRLDLTANKQYSLSDQTKDALKGLDEKIEIFIFSQAGSLPETQIQDLLKEYKTHTNKIEYKFIDPDQEPSKAQDFGVTMYDSVVIQSGEKSRAISPFDMYMYNEDGSEAQFRGEQAITRAIISLTSPNPHKIYFITGHEEQSRSQTLAQLNATLESEGFTVADVNLTKGTIPEDSSVLVIAGPKRDFDTAEIQMLDEYLQKSGHLMVFLDPSRDFKFPNLHKFLYYWGITLHDDIVIDPDSNYYFDALTLLPKINSHPITDKLMEINMDVVLPYVRSMDTTHVKGGTITGILRSSVDSWGETNFTAENAEFDENADVKGPTTVGAVVSIPAEGQPTGDANTPGKEMRLMVIGTSSFLMGDTFVAQGNKDLFMNSVHWMVGQEDQITVRPREVEVRELALTEKASKALFYITVLVIPVLILATGAGIWFKRRSL